MSEMNLPVLVDQKAEVGKKQFTAAEKKNILADQKVNGQSNQEAAKRAGVSEATIRRWQKEFGGKTKSTRKRPAEKRPAAKVGKPASKKTVSVTGLQEQLKAAKNRIAELESELAVVKPVAKFYL